MTILFITLFDIRDIDEHGIYSDLMREFAKANNDVYIVSPIERRCKISTHLIQYDTFNDWHRNIHILKKKTLNIQKTNVIEKGIATILIEGQITRAIKKYFKNIRFDLILYSTPPITLIKPIQYVKKRDRAKTYLMLKDIFPQNAVDLGMLPAKGLLYNFFRRKEKKLYDISDKIGCMSQANVDYILKSNSEIKKEKVEICPNCIEVVELKITKEEKVAIRQKYDLPIEKKIFVYGGNLGVPQGVPFIIDCLQAERTNGAVFFLIVGDGTEYQKIETFVNMEKPTNVRLMKQLLRDDYDRMIAACDVGMIFLDYKFTIPNFPSRLLSYMQAGLPVLVASDVSTDVGKYVELNGIGLCCSSNDVEGFAQCVDKLCDYTVLTDPAESLKTDFNLQKTAEMILKSVYENSCE